MSESGACAGEVIEVLSWAPLLPLDFLPPLVPSASSRELRALVDASHVGVLRWPRETGPAWRLLYLTEAGVGAAAARQGVPPARLARARRLRPADLLRRLPEMPILLTTYELLACLAATWPRDARLIAWRTPWLARVRRPSAKAPVRLHAPAFVVWRTAGGVEARILWPDLAVQRVRDAVGHLSPLLDLQHARGGQAPTLLVVVPDAARAKLWRDALLDIAQRRGLPPVPTDVRTWEQLRRAADTPGRRLLDGAPRSVRWGRVRTVSDSSDASLVRGCDRDATLARCAASLTPADGRLLVFLARHAFLTRRNLARAMGWTPKWTVDATARLVRLGLVQVLPTEAVERGSLECLEPGLVLAAGSLGVPLSVAVHKFGFAGGGPDCPVGQRRRLAQNLAHTIGADGIFCWLLAHARAQQDMGADEALEMWRNPTESRLRYGQPDGYGVYRVRGARHGFFLEYDRGTEKARDYEQKLAAYHLDIERGTYQRDYAGFPTILFVAEDPASEDRFATAALTARVGRPDYLPLRITTAGALMPSPLGLRAVVWRTAESKARQRWPPGRLA